MKFVLLFTSTLWAMSTLACEPYKVTHIYDQELDSQSFVLLGGELKGQLKGDILSKETIIRTAGTDFRGVTYTFLGSDIQNNILTTEHRVVIFSQTSTPKGAVLVSQIFNVKNDWDESCNRLTGTFQTLGGSDVMKKFTAEYVQNHPEYIKDIGDVNYELKKFTHTQNVEKTLINAIDKKDLVINKDPKANFVLTLEEVSINPLSCSVKGELISQGSGEKTTMDIAPVTALNCSNAVKKLIQNTLPQN